MHRFLLIILLSFHPSLAQQKPNILFISVDDLNDWISPLKGHPQAITPNFGRLAKMGTTFTNAHCQSPLCNPSRTSVLIGKRPTSTGIYGLAPYYRNVPELAKLKSIPQYFRENGYSTHAAGKVFHGNYAFNNNGPDWDNIGPPAHGAPYPPKKLVNTPNTMKAVDWGTFPHNDEDKDDYKIAAWSANKLKTLPTDKPFFLATGFFLPHVPCFTTQKWMDLYPLETLKLPEILTTDRDDTPRASWWLHWSLPEPRLKFLTENNEWHNLVRSYLASISFIDAQLGVLLDALEQSPHANNTIIVLWSDHGFHLGEKLITGKNTLWERSTRVPLIFAGPNISKNSQCSEPVELLDIFPTLCDLTSLPQPHELEGHSLIPQLENHQTPRTFPAISNHNPNNNSVRDKTWRYILYTDGSQELYNLQTDPHEFHNLINDKSLAHQIERLSQFIPKNQKPHAPNSQSRILLYENNTPIWEGKKILPTDPIPEFE
jgi:choline-sulfatase